eukprot:jgi/Tetstr1/423456/TSEL_014137.t1
MASPSGEAAPAASAASAASGSGADAGAWLDGLIRRGWAEPPESVARYVSDSAARDFDGARALVSDDPVATASVLRGLLVSAEEEQLRRQPVAAAAASRCSDSLPGYSLALGELVCAGVVLQEDMLPPAAAVEFLHSYRANCGRGPGRPDPRRINPAVVAMLRATSHRHLPGATGAKPPREVSAQPEAAAEVMDAYREAAWDDAARLRAMRVLLECCNDGHRLDLDALLAPHHPGVELLLHSRYVREQLCGEPRTLWDPAPATRFFR